MIRDIITIKRHRKKKYKIKVIDMPQNQLNPTAIEILRNRMSEEERINFCREFGMNREPNDVNIGDLLNHDYNSFYWLNSSQGWKYWNGIYYRFTTDEKLTSLYI